MTSPVLRTLDPTKAFWRVLPALLALSTSVHAGGSSLQAIVRVVEIQSGRNFRIVLEPSPSAEAPFGAGCRAIIITGVQSERIRNAPRGATTAKTLLALKLLQAAATEHKRLRLGGMSDAFDIPSKSNRCDYSVHGLIEVRESGGVLAIYAYR